MQLPAIQHRQLLQMVMQLFLSQLLEVVLGKFQMVL
jgi:hypothetical protein